MVLGPCTTGLAPGTGVSCLVLLPWLVRVLSLPSTCWDNILPECLVPAGDISRLPHETSFQAFGCQDILPRVLMCC